MCGRHKGKAPFTYSLSAVTFPMKERKMGEGKGDSKRRSAIFRDTTSVPRTKRILERREDKNGPREDQSCQLKDFIG